MIRNRRKYEEHKFQTQVAQYLNMALPADCFWTSIDHAGGGRLLGALRKARGVKSGLADVWVVYDGRLLCIELKTSGGRASDEQLSTAHALSGCGVQTWLCDTIEEIERALRRHPIPLRATLAPEPATVKVARETA